MCRPLEGRITPSTFTVTNANDSGPGSLRQAVAGANAGIGPDDIVFDQTVFAGLVTVTLTSGEIAITDSVDIFAFGHVRVDGSGKSRLFNVGAATPIDVSFNSMQFANGLANSGAEQDGGAVLISDDSVTFNFCVFENNKANAEGGAVGVLNSASSVAFSVCTFTGNTAATNGGAVNLDASAGVGLNNCVFNGNTATTGDGGAVCGTNGKVTVNDSVFTGNSALASGGDGGAIVLSGTGTLTVDECSFAGNSATRGGGIACLANGTLVLTDSTLSGNTANKGGAGYLIAATPTVRNSTLSGNSAGGAGGALMTVSINATFTIQNTTITANKAGTGGGLYYAGGTGSVALESSIVSDNTAASSHNIFAGVTVSLKNSAVTDTAGIPFKSNLGGNILTATNLKLGPLAANGGPRLTHAVLDGSPCLNAGSNPAALTTDERGSGYPRVANGTADMGAYEAPHNYVVTLTNDEDDGNTSAGDLSLREAIGLANANKNSQERITFAVTGSINFPLTGYTPLDITDSIIIDGPGAANLRLDVNVINRILNINITSGIQEVFIDGLDFDGGSSGPSGFVADGGGAIRVENEALSVTDCTFSDWGIAGLGGVIYVAGGSRPLTIRNCHFFDNDAIGDAGSAVASLGTGVVTISDCEFLFNHAGSPGGAVYVAGNGATVTIERCDFTLNTGGAVFLKNASAVLIQDCEFSEGGSQTASPALPPVQVEGQHLAVVRCVFDQNKSADDAGAILVDGAAMRLTIFDCTISANQSSGEGAGIALTGTFDPAQPPVIRNTTITGNVSQTSGGGIHFAGNTTLRLENTTIVANLAAGSGGGVAGLATNTIALESTIVAGNGAPVGSDIASPGTVAAKASAVGQPGGFTLIDQGGNLPSGLDYRLSPFGNSGGAKVGTSTIKTIRPLPDSPLVGKGTNPGGVVFDQRGAGFPRQAGSGIDIGAVEAELVVTNADDAGAGSLRATALLARGCPGATAIVFDPVFFATPRTITLTTGEIVLEDCTVTGPGAGLLTVSGNNASGIFEVGAGEGTPTSLAGLTLTKGNAGSGFGGAIDFAGPSLSLTDCVLTDNQGGNGGAVGGRLASLPTLTLVRCLLQGNSASSNGGAILLNGGGVLTLDDCTVSGNSAPSNGANGGGVFVGGQYSTTTVRNSTISGNSSGGASGGIEVASAKSGALIIENSTIAANTAFASGGGVVHVTPGTTSLVSTIVAGNSAAGFPDILANTVIANHSLVGVSGSNSGHTLNGANNLTGTVSVPLDARLAPLADYGGPTPTHALMGGSPAINAGSNPAGLATDQRGAGFPRVIDGIADIGAFERPSLIVTNANAGGDGSLRQAVLNANALPGADSVTFDAAFFSTPLTISLSSPISIAEALTISGPGAGLLSVSGGNQNRVFVIDAVGSKAPIALSGLTITMGRAFSLGGGGIFNQDEALTLTDSVITANSVSATVGDIHGGGIFVAAAAGSLVLINCTVSANTADGNGGGIAFSVGGNLSIENSTLAANNAGGDGGALFFSGTVTSGSLLVRNSTLSGNTAGSDGGGIALVSVTGALRVQNSTLTLNRATAGAGGGIGQPAGTAGMQIISSILTANSNATAPDIASTGTVAISFSAWQNSAGFTPTGTNNLTPGLNLKLGPLASNGGPTQTHELNAGSPAINTGSNAAALSFDQRGTGFARVVGTATDIGSFEVQSVAAPPQVLAVTVNGGALQRSIVTKLSVTFDQPVTLPANAADAFQLRRQLDNALVTVAATVSGNTITLTFTGGAINGVSLADGRYTLTAFASKVSGPGGSLDGNGDGTAGDDFVLVGNTTNKLFRLFGDHDGDGDVDAQDFGAFRAAFGGSSNLAFDSDNDGDVDAADFGQLRQRFGTAV